jgi:hypothetical protein
MARSVLFSDTLSKPGVAETIHMDFPNVNAMTILLYTGNFGMLCLRELAMRGDAGYSPLVTTRRSILPIPAA